MHVFFQFIKSIIGSFYNFITSHFFRWRIFFQKRTTIKTSYVSTDTQFGKYCYVGYNTSITRATIGNYCSIANNVSIGIGEHELDRISTNSIFYDNQYEKLTEKPCILGNDVWIGVDSIVRRGVTIGNGAVIGANSFVNMDIPPYAIVVGSPANIIRYRFEDSKIDIIEKSEWWNHDPEKAKEIMNTIKSEIYA